MKRVVLDTSVLASGLRSRLGASYAVLRRVQTGQILSLVTTALFFEYEAVLTRQEHLAASGFTAKEMIAFLDAFAGFCYPVEVHFSWRPQLQDANDEMVLEAAVNGRADALVTFNTVHFVTVAPRFHLPIWLPQQLLQEIRP